MDDFNFDPRGNDDREHLLQDENTKAHGSITKHLETLQLPVNVSVHKDGPSGELLLTKTKYGRWKKYFVTLKDTTLVLYKKQGDNKPKVEIPVTFISRNPFGVEEKEYYASRITTSLSSIRLTIFSTKRVVIFSASSDSGVDEFYNAIVQALRENLGPEEYARREQAAQELMPLLDTHYAKEVQRAGEMLKMLQEQCLAAAPEIPKKQGYLYLQSQSDPNNFKKLYFTLRRQFIDYRYTRKEDPNQGDRATAKGLIALRYATVQPRQYNNPEAPGTNSVELAIVTPYLTYVVRAKHDVAIKEWLVAIDECLRKRNRAAKGTLTNDLHTLSLNDGNNNGGGDAQLASPGASGQDFVAPYKHPRLEYHDGHKRRTYKISNRQTIIGRSSTATLRLPDKNISRQHGRIDYANDRCVFIDLGSSLGTTVNGQPAVQRILKPGDEIEMGKTILIFQADSK